MNKFLGLMLILVLGAAGAWYADQRGWIDLPYVGVAATTPASGPAAAQGRFGRRRQQNGGDQPIPVVVEKARVVDVPVTVDSVGTVQALNTVTIRTQADGKLLELVFKDGQEVHKGDVLARIDPTTYQAQYDQAMAKKAQDEAQLANARIDLDRYSKLAQANFGSKQQADTQKAVVAQLEAQVRSDQAAVDNTHAILEYTTIRAPIDGRTGIRAVDAGNIVHASDPAGIVVITQVNPIAMVFTLPQQQLRPANAALARGPVKVEALEADNVTVADTGTVETLDNQVDQTTGTVKVKAVFANAQLQLWPGQFVNVRVYLDVLPAAVVVPTASVQRGPNGAFVYVLREDETVGLTKVTVGRQDEKSSVILAGVRGGDEVVTTGFSQLVDARKVKPARADVAAAAVDDAPAAPQRRRQGGPGQGAAAQAGGRQGLGQGGQGQPGQGGRAGRQAAPVDAAAAATTPQAAGQAAPAATQQTTTPAVAR